MQGARERARGVCVGRWGCDAGRVGGGGGSPDTEAATLNEELHDGGSPQRGGPAAALPRGIEPRPLTTIWPPAEPSQQVHDTAQVDTNTKALSGEALPGCHACGWGAERTSASLAACWMSP